MNYANLRQVIVHNQSEMDDIPKDYKGKICIECTATVEVSNRYYHSVVAFGNSSVVALENSSVEARGNSSIVARGNSSVVAWGNSSVVARENSSVEARENSSVEARGNSSVEARENSSVVAWDNSDVVAFGNSSIVARGNSSVEAWGNSSVVAWDNSSVVANANVQVVNRLINGKIQLSGNAREVFMPKTIHEFMDFYGIKHTKKTATFYKAVRKNNDGTYYSDYDCNFIYTIGKFATADCDTDITEKCGAGIHISHLGWALDFGRDWDNLAILEVKTNIDDIVLPNDTNGKVRTPKVKVLREVPLEDCGVLGKILAKRKECQV